jgi:DNA-binding MarR family transcriptional regulator
MAGARVVAGVIARSLAEVEDQVTLPQLRVLVVAFEQGSMNLGEVAEILSVHPSNATRLVDRLVQRGLLDRRDDPQNRRQLQLTLTEAGRALVTSVLQHRRLAFQQLLAAQPRKTQQAIAEAMSALTTATAGATEAHTWVVPTAHPSKHAQGKDKTIK